MSHEIEGMVYAGEVPWHGLGIRIQEDLPPLDVLRMANLDWSVEKYPQYIDIMGEKVSTGSSALVRSSDNKILSLVSDDWKPVQNITAFEFFDEFCHSGKMNMHTAGSLKGGKNIWALAKVEDSFSLFGEDQIDSYLLFSNPHEYGKSIDIRFTPIRVVCNNTLTLALNQRSDMMVRLNHRRDFDPELVKKTLFLSHNKLMEYKEAAEFLGNKRYNEASLKEYLKGLFPTNSNKKDHSLPVEVILRNMETQPGNQFATGSWWQAFNGVTFVMDHILGRNNDNRMSSNWFGQGRVKKVEAFNTALDYAKAA